MSRELWTLELVLLGRSTQNVANVSLTARLNFVFYLACFVPNFHFISCHSTTNLLQPLLQLLTLRYLVHSSTEPSSMDTRWKTNTVHQPLNDYKSLMTRRISR